MAYLSETPSRLFEILPNVAAVSCANSTRVYMVPLFRRGRTHSQCNNQPQFVRNEMWLNNTCNLIGNVTSSMQILKTVEQIQMLHNQSQNRSCYTPMEIFTWLQEHHKYLHSNYLWNFNWRIFLESVICNSFLMNEASSGLQFENALISRNT